MTAATATGADRASRAREIIAGAAGFLFQPVYVRYHRVVRYLESAAMAYMAKHAVPEGRQPRQPVFPVRRGWEGQP